MTTKTLKRNVTLTPKEKEILDCLENLKHVIAGFNDVVITNEVNILREKNGKEKTTVSEISLALKRLEKMGLVKDTKVSQWVIVK